MRTAPGSLVIVMLSGHFVRRGAGAAGIGEDVHIGEAAFPDEGQSFGKFFLRLPGKGHNQIRGDGAAGEEFSQQLHALIIAGDVVFPPHPLQHRVAAGLKRQVELGAEIGKDGEPFAEFLRHNPGFQTAQRIRSSGTARQMASISAVTAGLPGRSTPQEAISMPVTTISR